MGWNRRRSFALGGLVAVAGLLLAVVPALGTSHQDAVRLHLGTDGEYFEYEGIPRQNLTSTRCEINELDGPVMALDADRKVGLNSFGIGVKSGGAQGTPCGRVDTTESLTLSVPTTGVLSGRLFDGARLDLELKGDARVVATLHNDTEETFTVFELGSGSSIEDGDVADVPDEDGVFRAESTDKFPNVACGAQSDSGPDAGAKDNCLWTITTAFEFNRIVFTTEVGEFSLEGSADYGNDPAFDTLFYIANAAPVAVNDDDYSTRQNTTLTVAAKGVLENDTDLDGDSLSAVFVSGVSNGTLSLNADGSFTYAPDTDFTGSDSFTYKANDGEDDSNTATVSINVTPTLACDTNVVFSGEGEPTYTVRAENGGVTCTKDVDSYDAGVDVHGNAFVELITSSPTDPPEVVVFLELLELEPQVFSGSAQTPSLYYDDNLNDSNPEKLAPFCLVDPRADLEANVDPEFDLATAYDSAAEANLVLPTDDTTGAFTDTTCIISAEFVTTGTDVDGNPLVKATYWLFNLNDGFRTFK